MNSLADSVVLWSINIEDIPIWARTQQNLQNDNFPQQRQISQGIHTVQIEASVLAWRSFGSLATKSVQP